MNPQVMAVVVGIGLAYYGGRAAVHGVKKAGHAIVHVVKKIEHPKKGTQ